MNTNKLLLYTIVAIALVYGMPKSSIYIVHADEVVGVDQNIRPQIKTFEKEPGQQLSGSVIKPLL